MIGDFYVIFYVIFGEFLVGTGEPLPYCDKIRTKSLFSMVFVFVLKSWDWVRPPYRHGLRVIIFLGKLLRFCNLSFTMLIADNVDEYEADPETV